MIKQSFDDLEHLREVALLAQIGWCEIQKTSQIWIFSEYLVHLLGLKKSILKFSDFLNVVREDYQERVFQEFSLLISWVDIDITFPIYKEDTEIWIHLRLRSREGQADSLFGFMQQVEVSEGSNSVESALERVNNLLYQQNAISRSLLDFLRNEKADDVINFTLSEILKQFNGGRVYIFEYHYDKHIQRNTYEVVSKHVTPQIHLLQNVSMDITPWWNRKMATQSPIILNTMDDFPLEVDDRERHVIIDQGIVSLMVVPLINKDQVWGFIGIDIVLGVRYWSKEDYQWFTSLANMISICIELRKAKDKAVQERHFLYNLYTHMPIGYLRLTLAKEEDSEEIVCWLNDANDLSGKYTGKPIKDYIGQKIDILQLGSGFTAEVLLEICRSKKHKELDVFYADSGCHCHCILYSPESDEIVILVVDMTATIETTEALERSQRMFKNIFDNSPVGVEIYDKDGYLIDINNKDLEIFGTSKESALGVCFFNNPNVPDSIKEKVHNNELVDFRLNYSFECIGKGKYYQTERIGCLDLYSKVSPLYDNQGNVVNYILINIDNTEQRDAINRIRDFEYFFSLISDYAKLGYVKANLITKEGYAVQQWFKNIGEDVSKELSGVLGIYERLHPEDREKVLSFYQDAIVGNKKTFKAEIRVRQRNTLDEWRWLLMNSMVTVWQPEENEVEIIEVNYDITDQKIIEARLIEAKDKAETMDNLKSAFLANMSHEIRTPLNAIVGFSSLLMETEDPEERKEYIEIVQKNNECLLQLISDVLDLAKIEAGTFEIRYENVNIRELCQEIRQSMRIKMNTGVELCFDEGLAEYHLFSDRNRIRQIISNFITNAIKFTEKGSIRIGYELLNKEELLIFVEDTGCGIAKEQREQIFERFVKVNSYTQGTGLGLSICQSLVARLGGRIGVDSQEGKGSRFWIILPFE